MTTEEEVAWCGMIWNGLKPEGVWAVPRSGLMFQKQSTQNALVLITRMAHQEEMPFSAEQLREAQDSDLLAIRERFALLNIEVRDDT